MRTCWRRDFTPQVCVWSLYFFFVFFFFFIEDEDERRLRIQDIFVSFGWKNGISFFFSLFREIARKWSQNATTLW
jgi:hypothetical protein